ncbi:MAG: alkaline phosphatase family protein [Bacteroidetes bacterium]|nr:alkaline phosphatase family protein [Bacteroidota bacterium]
MKHFILITSLLLSNASYFFSQTKNIKELLAKKRVVIIMLDGFGMNYYQNAPMPNLKRLTGTGFFREVKALMPTVTNANNTSICCGNFPDKNGITGNSFLAVNDKEEYMESKELVLSPTIFEKLKKYGIKSALLASKKKSIALLSKGADIALSPEIADSVWVKRLGKAPNIYSPEVNYWTMEAALDILKDQKDIRCLYIHTTDYPMHMWEPSDSNSLKHLMRIDEYIDKISKMAPDAMILITADHDLNHKDRCVDIENALAKKNVKVKIAISAERDKYLKHHRGFGGTSFVYLNDQKDEALVKKELLTIKGVKTVLTKKEASKEYHLMPERIGDLIVFADSLTVFGNLENKEEETLPANYRTHGSEYEIRVPLLILNAEHIPPASYFKYNKDLTTWLFREN